MPLVWGHCDGCSRRKQMTVSQQTKRAGSRCCVECQHETYWDEAIPRIREFARRGVADITESYTEDVKYHYGRFAEEMIEATGRACADAVRDHGMPREVLGEGGKGVGGWSLRVNRRIFGFETRDKGKKGDKGDKNGTGGGKGPRERSPRR